MKGGFMKTLTTCGKRLSYEGFRTASSTNSDELIAKYGPEDEVEPESVILHGSVHRKYRSESRRTSDLADLTRENAEEVFLREILGN